VSKETIHIGLEKSAANATDFYRFLIDPVIELGKRIRIWRGIQDPRGFRGSPRSMPFQGSVGVSPERLARLARAAPLWVPYISPRQPLSIAYATDVTCPINSARLA
jgi:hypothetical protein